MRAMPPAFPQASRRSLLLPALFSSSWFAHLPMSFGDVYTYSRPLPVRPASLPFYHGSHPNTSVHSIQDSIFCITFSSALLVKFFPYSEAVLAVSSTLLHGFHGTRTLLFRSSRSYFRKAVVSHSTAGARLVGWVFEGRCIISCRCW